MRDQTQRSAQGERVRTLNERYWVARRCHRVGKQHLAVEPEQEKLGSVSARKGQTFSRNWFKFGVFGF